MFWGEVFILQGVQLDYSTAYHPQSDGQFKATNKTLQSYFKFFMGNRPKDWINWLPMVEWWYNTIVHASTSLTPFESLYNYPHPKLREYFLGSSQIEAVDATLKDRELISSLLKQNLQKAQERMKKFVDL